MSTDEVPPAHDGGPGHVARGGLSRGWLITIIIAAVVIVALIIAVIALANPSTPSPTTTPPPTTTTTAPPTTPPPTSTTAPAVATCTVDHLTVKLGTPDGSAGATHVPLIFVNTGSTSCTLEGFPGVSFVGGGNGTQIGSPAAEDKTSPITVYTLATGDSVQTPLTIADGSAFPDCAPVTPDGFRVYPPHSTASVFVASTDYPACSNTAVVQMTVAAAQQN